MNLKISIIDFNGSVLRNNFVDEEKLNVVKSLIEEVSESYNNKLQAIDEALAERDKKRFFELTKGLAN